MLKWLSNRYQVVSHSTAVDYVRKGNFSEPIASISFDDGFKNNRRAASIMSEHGMKGCFFVCPGIVGETSADKIGSYCRDRMLIRRPVEFMDWDDLQFLLDNGHEVGNHSQSHLYMMDLTDDQFDEEVSKAREQLVSRLGDVKHFAWPYGRFFHFKAERIGRVIELGHDSCASGERGSHLGLQESNPTTDNNFCLRRDSLDMSWPTRHIEYFIEKSSANGVRFDDAWPKS